MDDKASAIRELDEWLSQNTAAPSELFDARPDLVRVLVTHPDWFEGHRTALDLRERLLRILQTAQSDRSYTEQFDTRRKPTTEKEAMVLGIVVEKDEPDEEI